MLLLTVTDVFITMFAIIILIVVTIIIITSCVVMEATASERMGGLACLCKLFLTFCLRRWALLEASSRPFPSAKPPEP